MRRSQHRHHGDGANPARPVIKLLIADDHPVVREGLRSIVAEHQEISVVAEAGTGEELLDRLERTPIDVVLLDISMPGPGFLDLLHRLKTDHPRVRIVVLSIHPEEQYAIRAFKAGAVGYLTKDLSPGELVEAILKVHGGGKYVSPSLAQRLADELGDGFRVAPHNRLSNREYDVLRLLGAGHSVKAIAHDLRLSPKTVSTYRTRILEKMTLKTNADVIRYVRQHGLTD